MASRGIASFEFGWGKALNRPPLELEGLTPALGDFQLEYLYIDRANAPRNFAGFRFHAFQFSHTIDDVSIATHSENVMIVVPTWSLAALLAVFPVITSARAVRSLKARRAPGCCARCGYDLKATPNQCPECGAVPSKG